MLLRPAATQVVLGVVYAISRAEKPTLDLKEGLGNGYEEKIVSVVALAANDGRGMQAFMYYATNIDPLLKPFRWYKEHVLQGARENDFPHQYVQRIARVESIDDFDLLRNEEEMGIYSEQLKKDEKSGQR
jgi:hypothetical protein